jgi:hypothetical protein
MYPQKHAQNKVAYLLLVSLRVLRDPPVPPTFRQSQPAALRRTSVHHSQLQTASVWTCRDLLLKSRDQPWEEPAAEPRPRCTCMRGMWCVYVLLPQLASSQVRIPTNKQTNKQWLAGKWCRPPNKISGHGLAKRDIQCWPTCGRGVLSWVAKGVLTWPTRVVVCADDGACQMVLHHLFTYRIKSM